MPYKENICLTEASFQYQLQCCLPCCFNVNESIVHYIQQMGVEICHFVYESAPESDKIISKVYDEAMEKTEKQLTVDLWVDDQYKKSSAQNVMRLNTKEMYDHVTQNHVNVTTSLLVLYYEETLHIIIC